MVLAPRGFVSKKASAGFAKVFEDGLQTSYHRTWERSHMDKAEYQESVPAGYRGWIERGTPKRKATGWYEIQFKNRPTGVTSTGTSTTTPSRAGTPETRAAVTRTSRTRR